MVRIFFIAGLALLPVLGKAQTMNPLMYNPFPLYFWEQELHRRQSFYEEQLRFECQAIQDAWKCRSDYPKIENGIYQIYGVNKDMTDWRKVDVIVVDRRIIQVGDQTLSDGSKVSKGRAKGTLTYEEGGSSLWYFYFIRM